MADIIMHPGANFPCVNQDAAPVRAPAPWGRQAADLLIRLIDLLLTWQQRASERRSLLEVDERMLRDMGLSRADLDRETRKPFWRA